MSDENTNVDDVVEEEVPAAEAPADAPAASLGINDLNLMAGVLEATAQRGAIRANEMEIVGNLYSKLMNFLIANGVRPAPGANPPASPEAYNPPASPEVAGEQPAEEELGDDNA